MTMGIYGGTWKRYQRSTPAANANPNLGAGARLDHLHPVDPGNPFDEPTPHLPPMPVQWYAADDFALPMEWFSPVTYPVAHEPEGHDAGAVARDVSLVDGQRASGRAHSVDRGSAAVQRFEPPIQREDRSTYQTQRLEAVMLTSGSRAALTRGRNSLPENNPDGPPPQGHYVMRWIDRQVTRRSIRHDMVPLTNYRAQDAVSIPAPTGSNGNQYTSPYPNLANARNRKLWTPQIRRVPRPPDDAEQVDGSADPQYSAPVYWDW